MKKIIILMCAILFSITTYSEYFFNETSINIEEQEKEYNYYAKILKEKYNISVYFDLFVFPKTIGTEEQRNNYFQRKKLEFYKSLKSKEKGSFIGVIYEASGNGGVAFSNEKNFSEYVLKEIIAEYIDCYFEYIHVKLNKNDGEIEKIFNNREFLKNKEYIEKETIGMLGLTFLKGIANQLEIGITLKEDEENILKTSSSIKEKLYLYTENLKKQEEERLAKLEKEKLEKEQEAIQIKLEFEKKQKEENEKIVKEKDKENKLKEKELQEEIIANKWNYAVNFSTSYEYNISEKKVKDENVINPITGLVDEVYETKQEGDFKVAVRPILKSKENGELEASLEFIRHDDFLNSENNNNDFRFEFIRGKFLGETYTLEGVVGDMNFKDNSFLILNDEYRGYYSSIQYYLNYNPDKWSYNQKLKKGIIKNEPVKAIKLSGIYAPEDKAFGEDVTQPKVSGMLIEGFYDKKLDFNGEKEYKYHFGYVYGTAKKGDKINNAHNGIFESVGYINKKYPLQTLVSYISSNYETKNERGELETYTGERIEAKGKLHLDFGKDFTQIYLMTNYSSEDFNTSLLSASYNNGIPEYVSEKSLIGGYGYEINIKNSLLNHRLENQIKYADFKKIDNEKQNGGYKELELKNNTYITKKNILGLFYRDEINYEKKNLEYLIEVKNMYAKTFRENKTPIIISNGNLIPSYYKNEKYDLDSKYYDKFKLMLTNNFNFNYKNIYDINSMKIYSTNYSITDEKLLGFNTANNLGYNEKDIYQTFKTLSYSKPEKSYDALNNTLSQDIKLFSENLIIFTEDIETNLNMKNYKYIEKKENLTSMNIGGYDVYSITPIKHNKFSSIGYVSFRKNEDKLNNNLQQNHMFKTNNTYRKDNRLSLYINYTFLDNQYNTTEATKATNNLSVNDEDNTDIISGINTNINNISDEMSEENKKVNDVEAGIKYKFYQKVLKDKNSEKLITNAAIVKVSDKLENENLKEEIAVSVISGAGYEQKTVVTTSGEDKMTSPYFSSGLEFVYKIRNRHQFLNIFNYRPYFKEGDYSKYKLTNTFGYYYKTENFENIIKTMYETEEYNKKTNLNEELSVATITGKYRSKNKSSEIQYGTNLEIKNPNGEKKINGEILLKSKVYENKKQLEEKSKNKKWYEQINRSNIFLNLNTVTKDNLSNDFTTFTMSSGGEIISFQSKNTFSISGGINIKKDRLKNIDEEYSNLKFIDVHKITKDINMGIGLDYYVLMSSNNEESTTKKINFSAKLNVNKLILENLILGMDLTRSLEKTNNKNQEEINKGTIALKYSF